MNSPNELPHLRLEVAMLRERLRIANEVNDQLRRQTHGWIEQWYKEKQGKQ